MLEAPGTEVSAGINMEVLKMEFEALTQFIYVLNNTDGTHMSWMKFCEKERGGRQDLEQLSKLMSSMTSLRPWRFIVDEKTVKNAAKAEKLDKILDDMFAAWDKVREDERVSRREVKRIGGEQS